MRWPLRNQILLPFALIQGATVVCVTAAAVWFSVQQVEQEIDSRLASVSSTLSRADYPLTLSILNQLRKLSGAHFVVLDDSSRPKLATLDSTVDLASIDQHTVDARHDERRTTVHLAGETFIAQSIPWRGGTENESILILFDQTEWQAQRRAAIIPPLIVGAVLLAVAITASIVVSRRIGNRIARVQRQVVRIADGDFSPVKPPRTDDELRELAETVNRMAVILDESMQKIRETERDALLSQLVGGLAHQLRNAITGARISTQLHQRRCENSGDDALQVALQQLSLVEQQIKALLRVTRGETRTRVPGCVGEILDQTVSLVRPLCEHQNIELQFHRDEGAWEIPDADALRAALLNLIMNAIEAAGPTGSVVVNSWTNSKEVTIDVADNGPGIQNPEAIFEPFYSTKKEGVGLGLSLAKAACEECEVILSHHRDNNLTTFRMTLPVSEMPPRIAASVETAFSFPAS